MQLLVDRHGGVECHEEVDLGPGHAQVDVLEDRVGAIGHVRDDGLALGTATGVGTRELAERSLAGADARIDVALEDNLGAGGHVEVIIQVGLDDVSRHAVVQSAHELVLVLSVANGGGSHEGHQRGITEGHADGELLILLLGVAEPYLSLPSLPCIWERASCFLLSSHWH